MVAHLKIIAQITGPIAALLLAGTVSQAAHASPLPDPTRPPFESGAPAAYIDHATMPAYKSNGLQFIIITPGRRAAIINGHTVELGGKYGESTLVEVNEGSVVLHDAQGKRVTYNMFPGVGIKAGKHSTLPQREKTENTQKDKPALQASSPQAAPQEEK